MKSNRFSILLLFFIVSTPSLWSKTEGWQIVLANGDTISHVSLERLEEDSLVVAVLSGQTEGQSLRWISIESLAELRQIRNSKFWKGAGIGLLGGTVVGAVIGAALSNTSEPVSDSGDSFDLDLSEMSKGVSILAGGVLGGLAGFGLGGAIGSAAGKDRIYDFSSMDADKKVRTLQWLLSKESVKYW